MAIGDKLYIADKPTLDQVKALIGTANPASGDLTTVFKGLKLIADYVDTLESSLAAGLTIGRRFTVGNYSTTSSSYQTALSVSGKGTLTFLSVKTGGGSAASSIKLVIDGTTIVDVQPGTGGDYYCVLQPASGIIPGVQNGLMFSSHSLASNPFCNLDFKTSLGIFIKNDGGGNSTSAYWGYNI